MKEKRKPLKTLNFILTHPISRINKIQSLRRYFAWHISQFSKNQPKIHTFVNDSKLFIRNGMAGSTRNLYTGLADFSEMTFLLHLLNYNDLFIDVGSNVGSYTILASAVKKANTISIEPVPSTFNFLNENVALNNIQDLVELKNIAVGSNDEDKYFSGDLDDRNHILTKGEISQNKIKVKQQTLDGLIGKRNPILMKIDVEGYETEVLKGANNVLSNKSLKAIIIELIGIGGRYNFDENLIHKQLLELGFRIYKYLPFERELAQISQFGADNTIYIRDIEFVKKRVKSSPKITVLGYKI